MISNFRQFLLLNFFCTVIWLMLEPAMIERMPVVAMVLFKILYVA